MASKCQDKKLQQTCAHHVFADGDELQLLRDSLLRWYDANKRNLPWRRIAKEEDDLDRRGYAVWVSEVMLQQTQVATVIDYYKRWMARWPDASSLAGATLEEVNEVWSGLGYYSRARRLWEAAKKVCDQLEGQMPRTSERLAKDLPGVGRYTACAVASIAYGQRVGVVDGNVTRVVARLRAVGADTSSKEVPEVLWANANAMVDEERPGDFNQALMELGATVCTPKNPSCSSCPLSNHCRAFAMAKKIKNENRSTVANVKAKQQSDIEDMFTPGCRLCLPKGEMDKADVVSSFPRKAKKAPPRKETTLVCVVSAKDTDRFLLIQRPEGGLLAGLLEFPSLKLKAGDSSADSDVLQLLKDSLKVSEDLFASISISQVGNVFHQFSHISQTYEVWRVILDEEHGIPVIQRSRWLSLEEVACSAISTAMKKVFGLATESGGQKRRKGRGEPEPKDKRQKSIKSFFSISK